MVRLFSIKGKLDTCEITKQRIPRLSRLSKEANRLRILHALDTNDFMDLPTAYIIRLVSGFLTGLLTLFSL